MEIQNWSSPWQHQPQNLIISATQLRRCFNPSRFVSRNYYYIHRFSRVFSIPCNNIALSVIRNYELVCLPSLESNTKLIIRNIYLQVVNEMYSLLCKQVNLRKHKYFLWFVFILLNNRAAQSRSIFKREMASIRQSTIVSRRKWCVGTEVIGNVK